MSTFWLVVCLILLSAVGFALGRNRAMASAGGEIQSLHSLPVYYGYNVGLSTLLPAIGGLALLLL